MARTRTAAFVALARALRGASGPGGAGLGESLRAVPRWVPATLTGRYPGTTRGQLGLLAAAVLYVVSPVDLVPEVFIPVLGLADDAFVITWLAGRLIGESGSFLAWERERAAGRGVQDDVPGSSRHTVQGSVVR
ncbi:hypothetical protein GCM10027446_33460 [Angustibacter peucedani]